MSFTHVNKSKRVDGTKDMPFLRTLSSAGLKHFWERLIISWEGVRGSIELVRAEFKLCCEEFSLKKAPVEEEDDEACVVEVLPTYVSKFIGWLGGP